MATKPWKHLTDTEVTANDVTHEMTRELATQIVRADDAVGEHRQTTEKVNRVAIVVLERKGVVESRLAATMEQHNVAERELETALAWNGLGDPNYPAARVADRRKALDKATAATRTLEAELAGLSRLSKRFGSGDYTGYANELRLQEALHNLCHPPLVGDPSCFGMSTRIKNMNARDRLAWEAEACSVRHTIPEIIEYARSVLNSTSAEVPEAELEITCE